MKGCCKDNDTTCCGQGMCCGSDTCCQVNMGESERTIRGAIAAVTLLLGLIGRRSLIGKVLIVKGGLIGATAVTGFCPFYHLLGIKAPK